MIQPGLDRISLLLKGVEFPWKAIHVAGTNGKGSICHYASTLLRRRSIRAGSFNSPHLIDRWDCIKISGSPVKEQHFKEIEHHFIRLNKIENINASPFEILTAVAFTCFNKSKVQLGIVEVGMGGKLDSTNILNNQAISVIAKIGKDHEAFLGNTLGEIAKHKAGILRPNVPYIVNPENEQHVQDVIDDYATEIGAGPKLLPDNQELRDGLYATENWTRFARPLRPFQRDNAAMAIIAVKEAMKNINLKITDEMIGDELGKTRMERIPGRTERTIVVPVFGSPDHFTDREIIVDGAHNVDAAYAMHGVVITKARKKFIKGLKTPWKGWPVTWVLAMTEGKDAAAILKTILHPGDKVITTSFTPVDGMPWVKPMDPVELFKLAEEVEPDITGFAMPKTGALRALHAAKHLTEKERPIVLTGSLYLVGDYHRELRSLGENKRTFWHSNRYRDEQEVMRAMDKEESERVKRFLTLRDPNSIEQDTTDAVTPTQQKERLKAQLEEVNRESELVKIEQQQVAGRRPRMHRPLDKIRWSDKLEKFTDEGPDKNSDKYGLGDKSRWTGRGSKGGKSKRTKHPGTREHKP